MNNRIVTLLLLIYYCYIPYVWSQGVDDSFNLDSSILAESSEIEKICPHKLKKAGYVSNNSIIVIQTTKAWRRREDEDGLQLKAEESDLEHLKIK